MKVTSRVVLPLFLAACLGDPTGSVGGADENAKFNVLFVGNSLTYANDLPGMLKVLIESAGEGPANVEMAA